MAQMPSGGASYAVSRSEADKRVHKAWNEDAPNTGPAAPAGSRRWVLQSLFGNECKSVDDLQLLVDMSKHFNGKEAQKQDGFDVQREADGSLSLGITWSGKTWPGDLEWQTTPADQILHWELTCTVVTGFIGKGPLAGYNELRRFSAHAVIPVESKSTRGGDTKPLAEDSITAETTPQEADRGGAASAGVTKTSESAVVDAGTARQPFVSAGFSAVLVIAAFACVFLVLVLLHGRQSFEEGVAEL